jgi:hypothetical protein
MQAVTGGREDDPAPPQFGLNHPAMVTPRGALAGIEAMTAHTDISASGSAAPVCDPVLEIRDTQWGFVVTEVRGGLSGDLMVEAALKFAALALGLAAMAQWLLPGSLFAGDVLLMKLALTAVLGCLAIVVFRFADRGFVAELQVDAALREIRVGVRNAQGISQVRNRIPMRDIEECFVRAANGRPDVTELCFRVAGLSDPVRIAAGPVADLAPVLERLTRDLRTPRARVALRMAG